MARRGEFSVFPINEDNEGYCVNDGDLNRCSGKQRSYIYGLLYKAHMDIQELFDIFGFEYEEAKEMTYKDASKCIDYLKDIIY